MSSRKNARTSLDRVQPVMMGTITPKFDRNNNPILDAETKEDLSRKVGSLVKDIKSEVVEAGAQINEAWVEEIKNIGDSVISRSSEESNHLLRAPMRNSSKRAKNDSPVAKDLVELHNVIEDLNPNKKVMGMIPRSVRSLVRRYSSSESQLDAIVDNLKDSSQELKLDNQALEVGADNIRNDAYHLAKFIYLSEELSRQLQELIDTTDDPEQAEYLRSNVLYHAVQREKNLKTHALVLMQGYQAIRLTLENNKSLEEAVKETQTTTLTALRTAVLLNNALESQKHVVDQVDATAKATENLVMANSKNLKDNSVAIQERATSTAISIDVLKKSYQDILEAMASVENHRSQATETIKSNIRELEMVSQQAAEITENSETPQSSGRIAQKRGSSYLSLD